MSPSSNASLLKKGQHPISKPNEILGEISKWKIKALDTFLTPPKSPIVFYADSLTYHVRIPSSDIANNWFQGSKLIAKVTDKIEFVGLGGGDIYIKDLLQDGSFACLGWQGWHSAVNPVGIVSRNLAPFHYPVTYWDICSTIAYCSVV